MSDFIDIIPLTSPFWAFFILILNIFAPGFGTLLMACFSLRFSSVNIIIGILQILFSGILIGYIWSIVWGVLCVCRSLETVITYENSRDIRIIHQSNVDNVPVYSPNNYPHEGPDDNPVISVVPLHENQITLNIDDPNRCLRNNVVTVSSEFKDYNMKSNDNQGIPNNSLFFKSPKLAQELGQINQANNEIQIEQVQNQTLENIQLESALNQKSNQLNQQGFPNEEFINNKPM